MENARVVRFEDSVTLANIVKENIEYFSKGRHKIVAVAHSLKGSLAILDQMANGEIDANTVLSDGNLSGGSTGEDVRRIKAHFDELHLLARFIVTSGQRIEDLGVVADADLPKKDFILPNLVELLDSLDELPA